MAYYQQTPAVPAGYQFTPEDVRRAIEQGRYIRVGPGGPRLRYFSGAERAWKKALAAEQNTIFVPAYRLTGLPEDVYEALRYAGVPEAERRALVENAISRLNYRTTHAQLYQKELAEAQAARRAGAPPRLTMADAIFLAAAYKQYGGNPVTRHGVQLAPVSGGRAAARTIIDKYERAWADNTGNTVVDVSNITPEGGKAVIRQGPNVGQKKGAVRLNGVPIISNNYHNLRLAVDLIFGPGSETVHRLQGALEAARQQLERRFTAVPPSQYHQQPFAAPPGFAAQMAPPMAFAPTGGAPPSQFGPGAAPLGGAQPFAQGPPMGGAAPLGGAQPFAQGPPMGGAAPLGGAQPFAQGPPMGGAAPLGVAPLGGAAPSGAGPVAPHFAQPFPAPLGAAPGAPVPPMGVFGAPPAATTV